MDEVKNKLTYHNLTTKDLDTLDLISGSNIRRCPFCGEKPDFFTDFSGNYVVFCDGLNCGVNPRLTVETISMAVSIWNGKKGHINNHISKNTKK